jgi:hypothetical protein
VPYGDTVTPKRLATVSPLDPQLFSTIQEHANELLSGEHSGKYSPTEVADWLESLSRTAEQSLLAAQSQSAKKTPAFRRMEEDVLIQVGLGRFFAGQIRSATLFELYLQTGDRTAHEQAVATYRSARDAWAKMAARASGVYRIDVTFGETPARRGHWSDRLPAIDWDLAVMDAFSCSSSKDAPEAIKAVLGHAARTTVPCEHAPPQSFVPGDEITLTIHVPDGISSRLFYRHVDQAERWQSTSVISSEAKILPAYTKTAFALEYYFELRNKPDNAWMYPGFQPDLANQPYFVISQRRL